MLFRSKTLRQRARRMLTESPAREPPLADVQHAIEERARRDDDRGRGEHAAIGEFDAQIDSEFEGAPVRTYHLAPPLFAKRNPLTGRPEKKAFGPWLAPFLKGLARMKGMRGRWCDPFRLTADRRLDRALLEDYERTITDLFYAKGLVRAGQLLGDSEYVARAEALMDEVTRDIDRNALLNDQQPLAPNNPVRPVPGRHSLAGRMIGLYAMSTFYEVTGEQRYLDQGLDWLDFLMAHHVASDDHRHAPAWSHDVWEFVDDAGQPYRMNSLLLSDPGHALEMVGLAFRLMLAGRMDGAGSHAALSTAESLRVHRLSRVLQRCFANGFVSPQGCGIVKLFDLATRTPVNDTMPWWSLPETMRAAALGARLCDGSPSQQSALLEILRQSFNAFVTHYVRRDLHLMAYQTLSALGQPVEVIPATPDADPGYHTSMSLMDMLDGILR
mgnify:CR=1 FL=1